MTLSELIERIDTVLAEYGDIELGIFDEDNWEILDVGEAFVWPTEEGGPCMVFSEGYPGEDYDPDPPKKDLGEEKEVEEDNNVFYLFKEAS